MENAERLERQLRAAIDKSNQSGYRIAKMSGVSESALSRFRERGTSLTLENFCLVAHAVGLQLALTPQAGRKRR